MSLRNLLYNGIPKELYDIRPGEICFYIHKHIGFVKYELSFIEHFCRKIHKVDTPFPLIRIVPTDNECLCDCVAICKKNEDVYTISVADEKCLIGLLVIYYDITDEELNRMLEEDFHINRRYNPEHRPISIPINKKDSPTIQEQPVSHTDEVVNPSVSGKSVNGGMGLLRTISESKVDVVNQISSLIYTSIERGYDIDFDELVGRLKREKREIDSWYLELDTQRKRLKSRNAIGNRYSDALKRCDIYITNGTEKHLINLEPVQKATYLIFLYSKEGFCLGDLPYVDFFENIRRIYEKIPDKQVNPNGIVESQEGIDTKTINGYRTDIRKAIEKHFPDTPRLVDKFAIEGVRGKEFKIEKSTLELRNQIKEVFDLLDLTE